MQDDVVSLPPSCATVTGLQCNNSIEQLMQHYDADGSGTYSWSEVKAIVTDLQKAQFHDETGKILISSFPRELQRNLEPFDSDGDGTIDTHELGRAGEM